MGRKKRDRESTGTLATRAGQWWVRYRDVNGRLKQEKVGRRGDAIDLLNKRRNERRIGVKLPDNLRGAGIRFKVLADDTETFSKAHHRDQRNILSRLAKVRPDFDERIAANVKPEDIDAWLTKNTKSAATSNRYRALFSLIFREALRNGKVKTNLARLVRQKHEESGVIRWLTEVEEKALRKVILEHHAVHLPELVIALGTGMRLSEQFKLTWNLVDLVRKEVRLPKTKNYSGRAIPMNADVEAAFTELKFRAGAVKKSDLVFAEYPRRWWEEALTKSGVMNFRWHDCAGTHSAPAWR